MTLWRAASGGIVLERCAECPCDDDDVEVACCENVLPSTLNIDFVTRGSFDCSDLVGKSATLTYNASLRPDLSTNGGWENSGNTDVCTGETLEIQFVCDDITSTPQWRLLIFSNSTSCAFTVSLASIGGCSPLEVSFNVEESIDGPCACCSGGEGVIATVTE